MANEDYVDGLTMGQIPAKKEPKQENDYTALLQPIGTKQETLEEAAEKWVFETNGHKWSNNDNSAGDNYGSFIEGVKWQTKRTYIEQEVYHFLDTLWDRLDRWYNEDQDTEFNLRKWFDECELKKK